MTRSHWQAMLPVIGTPTWEHAWRPHRGLIQTIGRLLRLSRLPIRGKKAHQLERFRARETLQILAELLADAVEAELEARAADRRPPQSRRAS